MVKNTYKNIYSNSKTTTTTAAELIFLCIFLFLRRTVIFSQIWPKNTYKNYQQQHHQEQQQQQHQHFFNINCLVLVVFFQNFNFLKLKFPLSICVCCPSLLSNYQCQLSHFGFKFFLRGAHQYLMK